MNILGVIPARWGSTRFEGKVLADIGGKPMIQHVYERTKESKELSDVLIACDDERVKLAIEQFDGKSILTSVEHESGTDRIVEVVSKIECDAVINIQGDEPLIHYSIIDSLAEELKSNPDCQMATVIRQITEESDIDNPDVVKVVIDKNNDALYFSRSPIPFDREKQGSTYFKHLGIYAYRKEFLLEIQKLPQSPLEISEKLEQLRVLEAGYKIKCVKTNRDTIGVDRPEDLLKIEKELEND